MILLAELMIFVFLGTLAVQGADFRENHACQNRRQTNIILLAEFMILMVLRTLAIKRVALVLLGGRKPRKIRVPGKVWA